MPAIRTAVLSFPHTFKAVCWWYTVAMLGARATKGRYGPLSKAPSAGSVGVRGSLKRLLFDLSLW